MLSGSPLTHEVAAASTSSQAIDFFRLAPLGSLASASLGNSGAIADAASDEANFTLDVEAGEFVSAVVEPANTNAIVTVQYVEGTAAATASAPGESAVMTTDRFESTGVATLRITSNLPTAFSFNIYRNTALEEALADSSAENRVDLGSSRLEVDTVSRYAVVGSTSLEQTAATVFRQAFESGVSFGTSSLWHTSDGRENDGLANHNGRGLYFGAAERLAEQTGTLNWDADLDATSDNAWESSANNGARTQWDFGATSNPNKNGPASNLAGVEEWYTLGAAASMDAIEDLRGDDATENDASFELVFRPRNFDGTHILFETGGNFDGTAMLLDGDTLEVRVQDDDNDTRRVVKNVSFDATADLNQFHHVVATVHPDARAAANQVRLFVNGVEVGGPSSATGVLSDWSGSDNAGLGRANSAFADSDDTTLTGNFDGDIALLRYHEGRLLGNAEVAASYEHLLTGSNVAIGNYNTGEAVGGDATSPTINLVGGSEYTLSFDSLIDVEDADKPFELMQVVLLNTATSEEEILLDRFDGSLPANTNGAWSRFEADLTSFAGESVQIMFRFDSVDTRNNGFEGWWIDNVTIARSETSTTDDDQFTVNLTNNVGQAVDIVLAGQAGADYAGQTLELWDPTGATLLATGVPAPLVAGSDATNYDLSILGYEVMSPGDYIIRVVSNASTSGDEYGLVLSAGSAFETETAANAIRTLDANSPSMIGYVQSNAAQVFTSRAAFNGSNAGLPIEDFEQGNVNSAGVGSFAAPLSSQTSNAAFPNGIIPGVRISGSSNGDLALVGASFFESEQPGSKAIGADSLSDNTKISFTDDDVTAVGFDALSDSGIIVRLYDRSDDMILSSELEASPTGAFFGATTNVPIGYVQLFQLQQTGELIDNLTFGTAGVIPKLDEDQFTLQLAAGDTVEITTSTPLDSSNHSPINDLNPILDIVGPGFALSDANSADDGKNARLAFTAAMAGQYTVRVRAESGQGEYIVLVKGLTICQPGLGDANGDGSVSFADFLILSSEFGAKGNSLRSDFDCDGGVTFADFLTLSSNFGKSV